MFTQGYIIGFYKEGFVTASSLIHSNLLIETSPLFSLVGERLYTFMDRKGQVAPKEVI